MKSHLESYPCPLIINSFWNLGFLLGITILLQIITGIFLSLQNKLSDLKWLEIIIKILKAIPDNIFSITSKKL